MDEKQAWRIAQQYADVLREKKMGMTGIYLFGSYVNGTAREDSDIDLAVVFDSFVDSFDMQVELMKLRRGVDVRIEPHPFRAEDFTAANPFACEILDFGRKVS